MHELAPLIRDLAIILGVASIVTLLFQKIRQPVVLGYIIAGVIIGPYTPPRTLVSDIPNIKILSELGVIFLMFSLGLDFSFHKLKRVGFSASVTGLLEVLVMLLIGFLTGLLLGWSFYNSLFLGAALSISSTTIIIKALEELQLQRRRFAELIFGILVVEDLLAILLLVGLSTIVITRDIISLTMLWAVLKLILVVGSWVLIGYLLVPSLIRRIVHYTSEENITVVSVALCLFLVCVAAYFNYSTALGAFIMGSLLAETILVHRIEQLIRPIRNIFAAVFFVSIGMLIDPAVITANLPLILLLTFITVIGKILTTSIGSLLTGQSLTTSLRVGFSMAQIGEFSFIIIGLGLALHAVNDSIYSIIVAVSAFTTFTTPYLIRVSGFLATEIDKHLSPRARYFLDSYSSWVYRTQATSKNQVTYWKAFSRLFINAILVAIIFIVVQKVVVPFIDDYLIPPLLHKTLGWLIAIVLASPFIWGMLSSFKSHATDNKDQAFYRVPSFLSWVFTFSEITILSVTFYHAWLMSIVLLISVIIMFGLLYKQLGKSYHWFEARLVKNLRTKSHQQVRYEELAPWDTHLVEIHVSPHSTFVKKSLEKLKLRENFGINIVAIYRNADIIFAPRGENRIFAYDKLIVLGNDDQIEAFRTDAEQKMPLELADQDLLENFTLQAFLIEAGDSLIGKNIRDSKIREKIQGLVVGLEREGKRILNPHSSKILKEGDLLLIVGESDLLKDFGG